MPKAVSACQQRGNIGGDAEIGRVSERCHPAKADQQVQAEREDRRDQDLAGEIDVEIAGEERQQKKQCGEQGCGNPFHAPTRPNRPCGRNAMTKIIGRNRMM